MAQVCALRVALALLAAHVAVAAAQEGCGAEGAARGFSDAATLAQQHLTVRRGAGGTSLCDFAKRCAEEPGTGVELNFLQTAGNCNFYGSNPANAAAHNPKLASCSGLLEHASASRSRSSWGFVQTTLDVSPPCPAVSFITVFREPWARIRSHLLKHVASKWPPDGVLMAREVYRRMAAGDSAENATKIITGKNFPSNGMGIVYLDNYHIRTLLGEEGKTLPWGSVTEAHYERAKAKLEAFDLVMPMEEMSEAINHFKCAAGPEYNLTKCRVKSLPHENDNSYLSRTKPPAPEMYQVEQLFRAQNKLDMQLYSWAMERWKSRQPSCREA